MLQRLQLGGNGDQFGRDRAVLSAPDLLAAPIALRSDNDLFRLTRQVDDGLQTLSRLLPDLLHLHPGPEMTNGARQTERLIDAFVARRPMSTASLVTTTPFAASLAALLRRLFEHLSKTGKQFLQCAARLA